MKRGIIFLTLIICTLGINICQAQNDFVERYKAFNKEAQQKYSNFRDECNKKYAEFIKETWVKFRALPPKPAPKDEKPAPPVNYEPEKEVEKPQEENAQQDKPIEETPPLEQENEEQSNQGQCDKELPVVEVIPPIEPKAQPKPVAPIKEEPASEPEEGYKFSFYGTDAKVRIGERQRFSLPDSNNNRIAEAWNFCSANYNNVIRDCLLLRHKHNLCDWAYLQMIKELSYSFFGKDSNEAALMTAFIYCQSGYKMKLASYNNRLYVLVGSDHIIYERSYFRVDNTYYYPIDCDAPELAICPANYPKEQELSLWIQKEPKLSCITSQERNLVGGRYPETAIKVSVNKNMLDFYATYPTSEVNDNPVSRWAMYADTPLNEEVKKQIYPTLAKSIEGKEQLEQVNILLNFVQTAFVYGYDDKIWGNDRCFFAEETLFYPYCDCEDRSVLFSRLVRDLVGLKVVLVYYPNHLATAVCFGNDSKGDYLTVGGKPFTICDPTYIGAPVGRSMPNLRDAETIVYPLN